MSRAPLRVCAEPGCYELVPSGRCVHHQRHIRRFEKRYQVGQTAYNSARWIRESARFRVEHPYCINAKTDELCTLLTDVTDHVQPHEGDPRLFWDRSNWQPMCYACHGRKTAQESRGKRAAP